MLEKLRAMLTTPTPKGNKGSSDKPRLSDMPHVAGCHAGTDRLRVKPSTLKKYRNVAARMREYFGEDLEIEAISRQQFTDWNAWLETRGTKEVTVNGYRHTAKAMWGHLAEQGLAVCDIAGLAGDMPLPRPDGKAIDPAMFRRLVQTACVRDAAMLWFTLQSGIRRQTIARLTLDKTTFWQGDAGDLRMCCEIPEEKAGPPRLVFAMEESVLAIRLWLKTRQYDSPYIFNRMTDGEALSVNGVASVWRLARERAGISSADLTGSWHSLRHAFCQDRLTEFDLVTVSQWMGISPATVSQVYGVRSNQALRDLYFRDRQIPSGSVRRYPFTGIT